MIAIKIKSNIIKKVDHNKSANAIEWNETESGSKWIKALIASKQTHEHIQIESNGCSYHIFILSIFHTFITLRLKFYNEFKI